MTLRRISVLAALGLLAACSSKQSADSDPSDGTVAGKTQSDDEEDEEADEPTEVAGAFLTAFGTVANPPAVTEGTVAVGVTLFTAANQARVDDFVHVSEVTYYVGDAPYKAKLAAGYDAKSWHAVFEVASAHAGQITHVDVKAAVDDGTEATLASKSYPSYDPVAGTKPDFTAELEGRPDLPAPLAAVTKHVLFVSDGLYQPGKDFSSLREANKLCNRNANLDAELKASWYKAVLSDSVAPASTRLKLHGPVETILGEAYAADAATFFSGGVAKEVLRYGNRALAAGLGHDVAWTGTKADGSLAADGHCADWKGTGSDMTGNPGDPAKWLEDAAEPCAKPHRLYCISYKVRN